MFGAAAVLFGAVETFAAEIKERELYGKYPREVRPFLEKYCLNCHDSDAPKADLDLNRFATIESVLQDSGHWELVLERLKNGDMPPAKAKQQPSAETRKQMVGWIESLREHEALKHSGDPGPVPARRLSNAEYDYTIRDLTGVNIRPTRAFPVDPANQAGFDNSGESLAMSPALVKKYMQAAREVADHLVLQPEGFSFAPHPVVADTDRDKWAVFRIVNFYKKQPTDYAAYFYAAWRFKHRSALGRTNATLGEIAEESKVSAKYFELIWKTLNDAQEEVGPIAKLQASWRQLPAPSEQALDEVSETCAAMRDYVVSIREQIVPVVKNLSAPSIQSGSQTLVLWKNRQMAANRRKFDPGALEVQGQLTNEPVVTAVVEPPRDTRPRTNQYANRRRVQAPTPDIVKKGGFALPPAVLTTETSATAKMAALKNRRSDPELFVPADPAVRARYEAAFARFADIFPDAFYITERARVYMDAEKEQENAGRLLSAGLHSMTGYFRDDQPLYDLILDEAGQRELDMLWREFDFVASIPQRMHTSFVWFERTDSSYMRDPEFDPYRPEDKSVTSLEKVRALGGLYLAKAQGRGASELAQQAIKEHFQIVATNILRVEADRAAAIPSHLKSLEGFAERAFRRPLSTTERDELHAFYKTSREENGVEHEEAMRDCIVRVLMSPNFLFRMDLVEASGHASSLAGRVAVRPLSPHALASRLSYFLWASMPDDELTRLAAAGDLTMPEMLKAQVRRMLKDPRTRNFATEFAGNWLDFRRFEEHNSVDRARFPMFNNELRSAMFEEPVRFFMDVARNDRSVLDFLYGRDTFVNATLARHYGIDALTESDSWERVENARSFGRGGLLPMAAFLTANSPGLRTSPVKRGNWVVKRILGERIPPPPAVVPELPADEKELGNLTLRDALARHRDNEACAGCHARFDSFGLVFESYGPVGERRARDLAGRPVDTRAEFPNGSEGEGLEGLLAYIGAHRQNDFLENLCRKMLAYALGRTLILSDDPLIRTMRANLGQNGFRFSTLIETIVTSPQFLNKRAGESLAKN